MSQQREVITQAGLAAIKFDLEQIGENLNEHSNDSLSKAHAINLAEGYTDSDGNDRTAYRDASGNVVGTRQLRFNIGGVVYYAPCTPTADAGQPDSSGQIVTTTSEQLAAVGKSAWATDFISETAGLAESINTDFLLPHTLRKHEEVHGNFTATAENVFDSNGTLVGRHTVRWIVNGIRYAIPADTRLGGPPQAVSDIVVTPASRYTQRGEAPFPAVTFTVSFGSGTQPFSFVWQINSLRAGNSPTWVDLDGAGGTGTTPLICPYPEDTSSNVLQWDYSGANTNTVSLTEVRFTIGGAYISPAATVRVKATNIAGDSYSNTVTIDLKDTEKGGSWVIYATHSAAPFTNRQMRTLYHLRLWCLKHRPEDTQIYMGYWGNELVERMLRKDFPFETLHDRVLPILQLPSLEQRYETFRHLVLDLFEEHWPDCPCAGVQQRLADRSVQLNTV